jgi:hypothetical protein
MVFFSIASLIRRSASARIASFDISSPVWFQLNSRHGATTPTTATSST